MSDRDAPAGRPPYWGKCENMSFAELYRFIGRAVEKLPGPSVPGNEELPRSEEELVALCDTLRAKADALKEDTPMSERPTYDGPEHPGPFTQSYELRSLYNKLERHQRRVDEAIERGDSEIYIEYVEGELEKVEREVAPVERREHEEHDKRVTEYREARAPYWDRLRLWEAEEARRQEAEANRNEAVRRMYRKVKHAFDPKHASGSKRMGTLPWEIAAPGERTDDRAVYRYYREVLSRGRLDGFDQERLDKVLTLPYDNWLKGTAGTYGYIVLMFAHTEKVLMECPIRDNAIYVLNSGEERLLKMNKQELIASGEAKRIFHTGDWYRRVKEALEIPPDSSLPKDTDDTNPLGEPDTSA